MSAPPIILRIGASVGTDVERAFQQIDQRAEKSARNQARAAQKGGTDASAALQREVARQAALIERAARAQDRLYDRNARNAVKAASERERAEARAAAAAERARAKEAAANERMVAKSLAAAKKLSDGFANSFSQIGNIAAREMAKVERAAAKANVRAGERFASRTSYAAARFLTPHAPLASMAARTASDLARGVGVDLGIGSAVSRNVALENSAIGLAQQERIATGGKTAGADHYASIARESASKLGVDSTDAVDMMRAFSGKTGEFGKLQELLERMGPLAVASGTGFQDMGDAAGAFFNQVKDLPDPLALTEKSMRGIIGQTAVGSVEMPDYAKQMGRLAANASKFEGDRAQNILKFSALGQLAMATGGATSAADSARSVAAFSNTLGKSARISAFKKAGVEIFADPGEGPGKNTKNRDIFEIIKDSIAKSGGNIPMLANMWADTLGRKPITALATSYNDAGGGEAGLKAIDASIAKFMNTTLTASAQQKNLSDHLASTSGKAKVFQAEFDRVIAQAQQKLVPALERVEPTLLRLADAFGSLATWTVDNPKQAIATAIGLSIARAGIENTIRAGLEKVMLTAANRLGGGAGTVPGATPGAAQLGGMVGGIGAALTVASLAVTTATIGMAVIDKLFDEAQQGQRDRVKSDIENSNAEASLRAGKFTPEEAKRRSEELVQKRNQQLGAAKDTAGGFGKAAGDLLVGDVLGNMLKLFGQNDVKDAVDARRAGEAKAVEEAAKSQYRAARLLEELNAKLADGITIKNMPGGDAGRVSQ